MARYDGYADWYDATFRGLGDEDGSAGLLARLLGWASADDPVCLDIGCGTGLHFAGVQAQGHRIIGVDISADQLRIAATRGARVIQGDARRLPLATASVSSVVMTFIHTDVDGFGGAVAEAARVLKPGGRLVCLGVHPTYVGAFVHRHTEAASQQVCIGPGYGDERLHLDPTGRFPVRSRVGARNLTLTTFLGSFLAQPSLILTCVQELDTRMAPWQPGSDDGRVVPWNIAVIARAVPAGADSARR
jgi:SAM-dependent methyltransferase